MVNRVTPVDHHLTLTAACRRTLVFSVFIDIDCPWCPVKSIPVEARFEVDERVRRIAVSRPENGGSFVAHDTLSIQSRFNSAAIIRGKANNESEVQPSSAYIFLPLVEHYFPFFVLLRDLKFARLRSESR
jgi:hypothetical protein